MYGCIYSKRLRKSGQNSLKNFLRVPSGLQSWAQTLNKSQLMKMNQVVMVIPCIALWCHTASARHLNWSGESWREAAPAPRTWLAHPPRPARVLTNTFQVGKCVITQGKLPGAYHQYHPTYGHHQSTAGRNYHSTAQHSYLNRNNHSGNLTAKTKQIVQCILLWRIYTEQICSINTAKY